MNGRLASFAAASVCLALVGGLGLYGYARLMQYEPGDAVNIDFTASPPDAPSMVDLMFGRGDFHLQKCCAESVVHAAGPGGSATAFNIGVKDPHVKGNARAEARLLSNRVGRNAVYGLNLVTPADWKPSAQRVIVAQWHGTDDFFLLEPGRFPPLELAIEGDRWVIYKAWDARLRSSDDGGGNTQGRKMIGSALFSPGATADWRFEVHWSTGSDGRVRAYKDGKLVADDKGPNALHDLVGPYMKVGVYVPEWKKHPDFAVGKREVFYHLASMKQL